MRKVLAWLGVATLFMVTTRAEAANDVLKPYVVLILDTSGSMLVATGSGPTSCGRSDTRINHAVCALDNIVNSYGDIVFSLGRFRETTNGTFSTSCDLNGNQEGNGNSNNIAFATFPTPSGGDQCSTQGAYCADCDPSTGLAKACTYCNASTDCGAGNTCNTTKHYCSNTLCNGPDTCATAPVGTSSVCQGTGVCTNSDDQFEVLTPLLDGNNASTAKYVDGSCGKCDMSAGGDPEIWGVSSFTYTPLAATLNGVKRYWEANQATNNSIIWASTTDGGNTLNPGYDPINRDPSNTVFLPGNAAPTCNPNVNGPGTKCTPYVNGTCSDGANCCCATQCRPYINILLTDGEETCTKFSDTTAAAASMLTTTPKSDQLSITQVSRTGGISTITTQNAPALPPSEKVGDTILVQGITNQSSFNGTQVVTAVSGRTISYAQALGDVAATAPTGTATVRHWASFYQYQVITKVIGFGITPGDPAAAAIEDIAHAGGSPDIMSVDEGYYAQNEADLELAISQILADSVRAELCNGRDDDCDVKIDEDFPNNGKPCTNGLLGQCAASGTLECRADGQGLQCNAPTVNPGSEGTVCNQLDDDCDGRVDEGLTCTSCTPTNETCNGADQDCDGVADKTCRCNGGTNDGKACNPATAGSCPGGSGGTNGCVCVGLTKQCGNGVCAGVEQCVGGVYDDSTCTAKPILPEQCNGADDDCDGVCDGFSEDCSTMGAACNNNSGSCPGSANPGDPSNNPIPENICRPGTRTCPLIGGNGPQCAASNTFGSCSGEIKPCNGQTPCVDTCNGLDDDCDNKIDEDFQAADCSTNCGLGTTQCVAGNITCNQQTQTGDATCNNIDDDCDGKFDEDWQCPDVAPADGKCDVCGVGTVCNGVPKCVNGQQICDGGEILPEVCNCMDDDCDGQTDEDPDPNDPQNNICPGGATCANCQCAFGCAQSEFPCPLGKKCDTSKRCSNNPGTTCTDASECTNGGTCDPAEFCVNDPCFNVTCPAVNGNVQTCIPNPSTPNVPQCVDTCSLVNDGDISNYPPCASTQICVGALGECRPNDCTTFPDMCTTGQSCINGTCVSNPCANVTCDGDKYCLGGECVASCADVDCPSGQRCRQGTCETDPCGEPCPFGQACNDSTGQCIEDPCKLRDCPTGQWCNPNDGLCEDDPCVANNVTCPGANQVCRGGTCVDPADDPTVDAGGAIHVTPGGGGCNTTGGDSSLLLALGLVGLLVSRRRRTVGGAL